CRYCMCRRNAQTVNNAKNFFESTQFERFQLPAATFCKLCRAKKFANFLRGDRLPPCFLELYIYDTEHADENRLKIMPSLCQDTIKKIVLNFHYLSKIQDLSHYKLIIKANSGLDQRVYNTPTVAIWIEGV